MYFYLHIKGEMIANFSTNEAIDHGGRILILCMHKSSQGCMKY